MGIHGDKWDRAWQQGKELAEKLGARPLGMAVSAVDGAGAEGRIDLKSCSVAVISKESITLFYQSANGNVGVMTENLTEG